MDRTAVIAIASLTAYVLWLLAYLFLVEGWLRKIIGRILGVSLERQFVHSSGKPELLDIFFVFSWKVVEPAGPGLRFFVGFLRVVFWLTAITAPIVAVVAASVWFFK